MVEVFNVCRIAQLNYSQQLNISQKTAQNSTIIAKNANEEERHQIESKINLPTYILLPSEIKNK